MHVIEISKPGGPEVLAFTEFRELHPGPHEVLVTVAAAGVNRADTLQRQGHYPPPAGAPAWPGLELSGVIAELGADVKGWQVGDRVAGLVEGGGYATHAIVPAAQLLPIPPGLDLVDAAALPEAVCTAWSNLVDTAGLRAAEWVLVHGGSGGVGSIAIQLAKAIGARVLVTAGSQERIDKCLALGADAGFVYRRTTGSSFTADLPGLVHQATGGHGADVILDIIGGAYLDANLRALATGGRLVVIGLQRGRTGELDLGKLLSLRASIMGTTLRARPAEDKARIIADVRQRVWPMLTDGRLRPIVGSRLPLREAARAHELFESGTVFGKILLVP